MNRREVVALLGTAATGLSGCLTPLGDLNETHHSVAGHREPAPPEPTIHPAFEGVSGRGSLGIDPAVAWIRSLADADRALAGFGSDMTDQAREYVEQTDFDDAGVLVYYDRLRTTCEAMDLGDPTIQDDRLIVDALPGELTADCPSAVIGVGLALRVAGEDLPSLALVERNGETISNRYRVELDRVPDDVLDEQADVISLEALNPDARDPVRTAIENQHYETEAVAEALAHAIAAHDYVRADDSYYALNAEFPEYIFSVERHEEVEEEADVLELETFDSDEAMDIWRDVVGGREYRAVALPPELRNALETYDYIYYRDHYFDLQIAVEDPGPPYVLRAEEGPVTEAIEEIRTRSSSVPVVDAGDLDAPVQEEVDAARDEAFETTNPPALLTTRVRTRKAHLNYIIAERNLYRPVITDAIGTAGSTFAPSPLE